MIVCQLIEGINLKPPIGALGFASVTLIKGESKNILFDVGGFGAREVISAIKKQNLVDCIFISHLHFDHSSNLDLYCNTDIPIYINTKELVYYKDTYDSNKESDMFPYFKTIADSLLVYEFEGSIELDRGIRTLETPGHTFGHSSLEITKGNQRLLIAGDAIKSINDYHNDEDYSNAYDPQNCISTKRKIKQENFDYIIPGHDKMFNVKCNDNQYFRCVKKNLRYF
ncbi:MBL fold metallo-hydrolase [Paenibacillus lautus]|uniref:MBL fold metallo-hydrolase n=1 Tax=Paenibacillus lautus TaxID=1401 RepID=UPI003D28FBE7